jgi:hypothetical protein
MYIKKKLLNILNHDNCLVFIYGRCHEREYEIVDIRLYLRQRKLLVCFLKILYSMFRGFSKPDIFDSYLLYNEDHFYRDGELNRLSCLLARTVS